MNVVLIGATRGMGRALARLLAARGDTLFLLGRNEADLERSARDLEVRGADGTVHVARCDLEDPRTFGPALERAFDSLGTVHTVVVTAGMFAPQEALESDRELTAR